MNKEAFLKQLERELKHIPAEDRQDAITYYREYLEEMGVDDNADASEKLGSPKELAKEIISACADKYVEKQGREGDIKNSATAVWLVMLGICAAPIALPLVLVGVIMLFVFLIVGFCVGITLFAMAIASAAAAVALILAIFVSGSIAQSAVSMGLALMGAGTAIFLFYIAKWFCWICMRGISISYRKFFSGKQVK